VCALCRDLRREPPGRGEMGPVGERHRAVKARRPV
jgi:hypothetical protein